MPEIIIDDIPVQFTGKANIIELAKSVGVDIPHFCYHPALSVSGNCRMCMVEVGMPAKEKDGSLSKDENGKVKISFMPKLQPSCYQDPTDGMVIRTKTEKVIQTRKHIMEFLLANHPLDCPICDQAGECVLQDYSFQYGFSKSQFLDQKRTFKKTLFSDVITPELNRCIHCDRCSRFTKEIAHDYSFTRTWRGNKTELSALPGEKITHNYQGNMVDICPVGALTLTDFRFKSRVWFLKHSEGLCTSCGKGCNVVYSIDKQNKVLRIKPRFNAAVNSYWMCDYGRLRYKFFNENRKIAHTSSGTEIDLNTAIEKAATMIKSSTRIAAIASANETLESMQALKDFAENILKTENIDYRVHSSQIENNTDIKTGEVLLANDPYPNSQGAKKSGLSGSVTALDILKNPLQADLLLAVLDDKFVENPDLMEALGKFDKIILFSPFVTVHDHRAVVTFAIPSLIEQSGILVNINGMEQKFQKIITPAGEAVLVPDIINRLTLKISGKMAAGTGA
ncbi:MAG: 2Fe-2S iron-sulfur cluster-binding protein [Spirochaetia bacterium]|nr:2Fe-2S iron-sulfur cluster-binding protein [Spirochaetia bacterium]